MRQPQAQRAFEFFAVMHFQQHIQIHPPGGVGQSMKPTARYLAPGDVVEVELQHVGVLRNPVVAERPGA